jgi:hypothetical protein
MVLSMFTNPSVGQCAVEATADNPYPLSDERNDATAMKPVVIDGRRCRYGGWRVNGGG